MDRLTAGEIVVLILFLVLGTSGIVVGYVLPGLGTNILKDIMVLASGAGVAYIFAQAGSRATSGREAEASKERVRSLCNRSAQRLGLTASQTRDAAALLREYSSEPSRETSELVAVVLDNLAEQAQVSIGDLEEMTGTKIGLDQRVAEALHAATEALPTEAVDAKAKVSQALEQLKASRVGTLSPVDLKCPQCGNALNALLGELPGSTAHTRCFNCQSRVVVHRGAEGNVISKVWARRPAASGASISVTCPSCKREIKINLKATDPKMIVRNCFHCDLKLYIDREKAAVDHSADSEGCRSAFRTDVDHDSEVMPISVPN